MEELAIVLRVERDEDDVTLQDLGGHLKPHVIHKFAAPGHILEPHLRFGFQLD